MFRGDKGKRQFLPADLLIGRSAPVKEEKERHRKDFQRNLKNPLTNPGIHGTITTKDKEKENSYKTRKDTIAMKNTTYATVYAFLTANGFDNAEILAEFEKEINRNAEAKQAKETMYAEAKPVVLSVMDVPATIAEIFEAVEGNVDLPEGFTKGNLQYAITRLWKDEVEKIEGKVNTYRRKA